MNTIGPRASGLRVGLGERMLGNGIRSLIVLLCCVAQLGCTVLRTLDEPTPTDLRSHLQVGDWVEILSQDKRRHALKITAFGEDALSGRDAQGTPYRIEYGAIRSVDYRRVSGTKTASGAALSFLAVVLIGGALLAHDLKDDD